MIPRRTCKEKIYVKVDSSFDETGYLHPTAIRWKDGRTFHIDAVKDFRPAGTVGMDVYGDCYTVVIGGHEKHLFFEHTDQRFAGRIGRWFVEQTATE